MEGVNPKLPGYNKPLNLDKMASPRAFKSHFPYDQMPCGPPNATPAVATIIIGQGAGGGDSTEDNTNKRECIRAQPIMHIVAFPSVQWNHTKAKWLKLCIHQHLNIIIVLPSGRSITACRNN